MGRKLIVIIMILLVFSIVMAEIAYRRIGPPNRTYCSPDSREAEFCTANYNPVCGWFNKTVQCIKYPCAETYSNDCTACANKNVEYWTKGPC